MGLPAIVHPGTFVQDYFANELVTDSERLSALLPRNPAEDADVFKPGWSSDGFDRFVGGYTENWIAAAYWLPCGRNEDRGYDPGKVTPGETA